MTLEAGQVVPLVDEGLGNSTWLLGLGEGRTLVVDPPRDLRQVRQAAHRWGLRLVCAADTHLHADFLSGSRQLSAVDGAEALAPAAGERSFRHRGLADDDEVDLGGLTLRALATPGHTDEHMSFLLLDGDAPLGVFTGGSLIVGAAARTDLLGAHRAEELARAQYASLQRLARLPEGTRIWPTHGAGSFCSAPPGAERSSTIGAEKATNPLLTAPDAETFVERLVGGLGSYPAYFERLAEINRRGPEVLTETPDLPALDVSEVRRILADDGLVVDVRPVHEVATGLIPGAIAIPLRDAFATWLGWIVPPDRPVVIVRTPDQDPADVVWPALGIGFEHLAGELAGGMPAWIEAGGPVTPIGLTGPDQVTGRVLDVRQVGEYETAHLPGAEHVELGALPGQLPRPPAGPTVVMCGHGERAMTGASLLTRAGAEQVSVLRGGPRDWATATGHALVEGS